MSKEFEEIIIEKLQIIEDLSKEQREIIKKLEKLDTLSVEFNQFRDEQRQFNAKQLEFNAKQEEFNAKQEEFNAKQEEFNAKQEEFNAKQLEFNAKQEELNKRILKRLDNIERNVVIIEDRVSNEIPALFDADKTRYQKQSQFETTLDSLDKKTEDHSVRILALEYTSEKHEGQLKDLVS